MNNLICPFRKGSCLVEQNKTFICSLFLNNTYVLVIKTEKNVNHNSETKFSLK